MNIWIRLLLSVLVILLSMAGAVMGTMFLPPHGGTFGALACLIGLLMVWDGGDVVLQVLALFVIVFLIIGGIFAVIGVEMLFEHMATAIADHFRSHR